MTQYMLYTPEDTGEKSVTAIVGGEPLTLTEGALTFDAAVKALQEGASDEELLALFRPVMVLGGRLARLSDNITFDGKQLYYDGDVVDDGVARHVVRVLAKRGLGAESAYLPTVRFLEKLYQNPSPHSRRSLYPFLRRFNFTLTPDGDFIAYKGVRADFSSINAGPGVVDGVRMHGHLPNQPGSTLEVSRSYVDDDTDVGCSTGLHAGTYAYARGFAQGGLLTVVVNPRDVVSVPNDCYFQKIRTSRYRVLEAVSCEYEEPLYID